MASQRRIRVGRRTYNRATCLGGGERGCEAAAKGLKTAENSRAWLKMGAGHLFVTHPSAEVDIGSSRQYILVVVAELGLMSNSILHLLGRLLPIYIIPIPLLILPLPIPIIVPMIIPIIPVPSSFMLKPTSFVPGPVPNLPIPISIVPIPMPYEYQSLSKHQSLCLHQSRKKCQSPYQYLRLSQLLSTNKYVQISMCK